MNATPAELQEQLHVIKENGLFVLLDTAAKKHVIPTAYVLAVGSRETNLVNELGDYENGEYFGVGILQIDAQHPVAREARDSGTWKTNPGALIDIGVGMMSDNLAFAKTEFPTYEGPEGHGWLKIAASAYNGGQGGAASGARRGDSDLYTTGHDYGADVMERFAVFQKLLGG
jgi:hypothetical protein